MGVVQIAINSKIGFESNEIIQSSQSSSQPSNSQMDASQDENKNDKNYEKDENKQISFYLKLGKYKKFKLT